MWAMPWELTAAQIVWAVVAGLVLAAGGVWALAAWLLRLDRETAEAALPPVEEWVHEARRERNRREVTR